MKILLHGFGAMGKMVLEEAKKRNEIEVVGIVDSHHSSDELPSYPNLQTAPKADVLIDFTHPSLLESVLNYGKEKQVKLVLATTGFSDEDLKRIEKAAENNAIFQSYNMSTGIRLLLKILKEAVPEAQKYYDIEIEERHHRKKIDAPSGTAWLIFRTIQKLLPWKKPVLDRSQVRQPREKEEIGLSALRGGTIFGEHTVLFAGEDELLEIKHTALSKRLFATGALSAAEFLREKETGLYNLENI